MSKRALIALSALALGGCSAETYSPRVADHWEVLQGTAQRGVPGKALDSLVRLRLVDASGRPMAGVTTTWSVAGGDGSLPFTTTSTDHEGVTSAQWHLGLGPGPQSLRLSASEVEPYTVHVELDVAEFTALAVGNSFACGLDADGVAWCWGGNYNLILGNDTTDWAATPLRIGDGTLRFVQLVAGDGHVCGREDDGEVWCWGSNFFAQLGQGIAGVASAEPVRPIGLPALERIDAGAETTCGLTNTGALWCWGRMGGAATALVPHHYFSGTTFLQVATGGGFSCGIRDDAVVLCWGDNEGGRLGRGSSGASDSVPAPIAAPISASAIEAAEGGACAITTSRDVYCWGLLNGVHGHSFGDPNIGVPSHSAEDSPALRISLGYYCGAIWQNPSSPRLLCPNGWTTDIEKLPGIIEVQYGWATLCLRAAGGVTYCKNYSDVIDPEPFASYGVAVAAPRPHP